MKTVDYRQDLLKRLKSPQYAAKLLRYSFEESCSDGNWEAFGLVLQDVIDAQGNKRAFAKKAHVSRAHLYRMFKKGANPTLKTLLPLLFSLGIKLTLSFEAEKQKKAA